MKEGTTYGLSLKRLARLLAGAVPPSATQVNLGGAGTPTVALPVLLSYQLLLGPIKPDSLPAALNRPCDEVLAIVGQPTSDLLLNLKTEPMNPFQGPGLFVVSEQKNLNNCRLLRRKEVMVIQFGRHGEKGGGTLPPRR